MKKRNENPGNARALEQIKRDLDEVFSAAVALHRQGRLAQAAPLYRAVLGVDPNHADALHLLGVVSHATGDHARASELIARAAAMKPNAPLFFFHHGVVLQALLRHGDAVDCYRRAVALKPDYREAYENLGVALQDLERWDEAAEAYRHALDLDSNAVLAHQNLGTLLGHAGRTAEARTHFAKVLTRLPAYGEAHNKMASTLLVQGRFREGWAEYEWRTHAESFRQNNAVRTVPFPGWDGSSLAGKTLLIHPEQGIGDEIMFASCYPDAIAAARRCLIECDPRLVDIFSRSFPEALIRACDRGADFEWTSEVGSADYRVSAGSLPRHFRPDLEAFPAQPAYLRPDPAAQAKWGAVLSSLGGTKKIGISWRGGRDVRSNTARSIPLDEWRNILGFAGASFVSLQYGDHTDEIASVTADGTARLHTLKDADPLTRVDDFIALLSQLDLVISIDNSTVFMAGSVGTPVWVLLPSSGEWRWLEGAATSLWHPTVRTFRQRSPGMAAWREVLGEVGAELRALEPRAASSSTALSPASADVRRVLPAAPRSADAVLVNDTSQWYHHGCSCTSLAIHSRLRERNRSVRSLAIHRVNGLTSLPRGAEELDDDVLFSRFAAAHPDVIATLESAATVYVNGEGTLHGMSPGPVGLLYLMYVAKTRLGRYVHLINHSCYPNGTATLADDPACALYRKVYGVLDYVAVRESVSLELVRKLGVPHAVASFDCLPLYVAERFTRVEAQRDAKTLLLAGSVAWGGANVVPHLARFIDRMRHAGYSLKLLVGANAYLAADDVQFAAALREHCGDRFELVYAPTERDWLRAIAGSALLVSGRFHHTIAAAFLDTPFIVMESNTPKITGLVSMLQGGAFVSAHEQELGVILEERAYAALGEPAKTLVADDRKAHLLSLSRANFTG